MKKNNHLDRDGVLFRVNFQHKTLLNTELYTHNPLRIAELKSNFPSGKLSLVVNNDNVKSKVEDHVDSVRLMNEKIAALKSSNSYSDKNKISLKTKGRSPLSKVAFLISEFLFGAASYFSNISRKLDSKNK